MSPIHSAPSTIPTWPSESENSERISGASTGSPSVSVENAACAPAPAARIAQR